MVHDMQMSDRIGRRMKLQDVHVFMTVVQAGTMGKAAESLNTSQPNVSRSIAELERALGVRLLDRRRQGIEPTPYGRALIKRGVTVFDELRQGVKEIEFIADPTAGEVRIGATSAIGVGIVAAVIDRISRKYPRVRFHVVTATPPTLFRELRERNVDMIIVREPARDEDIDSEILYEDRTVVVAATNNPWSRRRRVKLAELANEVWALPEPGSRLAAALVEAFRANGVEAPRGTVTASSGHLRDTLLVTGRFLTVLPQSLLHFP